MAKHREGFFFFQAEDGIRDADVTGVQTCALPIYVRARRCDDQPRPGERAHASTSRSPSPSRSEERRVGKECRCRWWPHHYKKKEKQSALQRCRASVE